MKKIIDFLFPKKGEGGSKPRAPWLYVAILLAAGAIVMFIGQTAGNAEDVHAPPQATVAADDASDETRSYERALELRLEEILSQVDGAGKVKVMITLSESAETVVAKDVVKDETSVVETDDAGGKRETKTTKENPSALFSKSGGTETPVTVKEIAPKIAGVLVVADGAGEPTVKEALTHAAAAATGASIHKVNVVKRKTDKK